MGSIKIDFDVKVINKKDYVPFDQVIKFMKNLDKHAPNVDLTKIANQLENQRDEIRANL